jgi:hypothetical protein
VRGQRIFDRSYVKVGLRRDRPPPGEHPQGETVQNCGEIDEAPRNRILGDVPILCDSVVLTLINNGEVAPGDFVTIGPSCVLTPKGRKALITAWERRLDQETTHPVFGYRLSLRRLIAVQCRLLARLIEGEIPELPHYVPR